MQVPSPFLLAILLPACGYAIMPDFLQYGSCVEDIPVAANFSVSRFLGVWYPVLWVQNDYVKVKSCFQVNYTMEEENLVRYDEALDKSDAHYTKVVKFNLDEKEPYIFQLPSEGMRPDVRIWVVDTDYENYVCLVSCGEVLFYKAEFGAIFSRTPVVPEGAKEKCASLLAETYVTAFEDLSLIPQGKMCPYWDSFQEKKNSSYLEEISEVLETAKKTVEEEEQKREEDGHSSTSIAFIAILVIAICLVVACAGVCVVRRVQRKRRLNNY